MMNTSLLIVLTIFLVLAIVFSGFIIACGYIKRSKPIQTNQNAIFSPSLDETSYINYQQGITVISNDIMNETNPPHHHRKIKTTTVAVVSQHISKDQIMNENERCTSSTPDLSSTMMKLIDPLTEKITLEY